MDVTGPDSPETEPETAFQFNLRAFGPRAARLCALLRRRRISADACFLALTQLWIQLARSRGADEDAPGDGPRPRA